MAPAASPEGTPEPAAADAMAHSAAPAAAPTDPPAKLAPPARRHELRKARPVSFVEPLGQVVTPEEVLELRVANRRVVRLLGQADASSEVQPQAKPRPAKSLEDASDGAQTPPASQMRTPLRRAALRDAKSATFVQPLPSAVDPEDVASLRQGITTIEEVLASSSLPTGPMDRSANGTGPQAEQGTDPRAD